MIAPTAAAKHANPIPASTDAVTDPRSRHAHQPSAASQPSPAGEGPFITGDWDSGYRAARLRALVEQQIGPGQKFDVGPGPLCCSPRAQIGHGQKFDIGVINEPMTADPRPF